MIKKTINFEDFNGKQITKDYYFHLSKVDFLELSADGAFENLIKNAVATKDKMAIFNGFKRLIGMSVGMRTEDGSGFVRTEAFRDEFLSSPAFDELVMELFTSDDKGADFIKGLVPAGMTDQLNKELAKIEGGQQIVDPFNEIPAWIRDDREPTELEMKTMTREQMIQLHQRKIERLVRKNDEQA